MNTIKCCKCKRDLYNPIIINLNGENYCPNCIIQHICLNESELPKNNIFIDGEDRMELTKNLLIRLICKNLTQKQYKKLKELYPNNWYLHDDFYTEDGYRLQPTK